MTTSSKSSRFPLLRWGCSATAIGCVLFLNPNLAQAGTALVSNPSNDSTATGTTTFEPPTAGTSFDGVAGVTTETTGEGATLTTIPESLTQSATAQIDFNGADAVSLVIVGNTSYSAADAKVTVRSVNQDPGGVIEQILDLAIADLLSSSGYESSNNPLFQSAVVQPLRGSAFGYLGADTTLGSGGALITTSNAVSEAIEAAIKAASQESVSSVLNRPANDIFSDRTTAQVVETLLGLTVRSDSNSFLFLRNPVSVSTLVPTALNDALVAIAAYITSQGGPESVSPEVRAISNILMQVKRDTFPELSAPAAEGGESGESGEDEA